MQQFEPSYVVRRQTVRVFMEPLKFPGTGSSRMAISAVVIIVGTRTEAFCIGADLPL